MGVGGGEGGEGGVSCELYSFPFPSFGDDLELKFRCFKNFCHFLPSRSNTTTCPF